MSSYAAAAGIVGGAIQSAAAGMERARMRTQLQHAEANQQGYRQWAGEEFNRGVNYWTPSETQRIMGQQEASRNTGYGAQQSVPMTFAPSMGTHQSNALDQASIQDAAQRQAHLQSYSDYLFQQTLKNMNVQRSLNRAGSFASGTAALLPLQLYQAQHSYDWLNQLGQSISTLGGAMGSSQAPQNPVPQMVNAGGQTPAMWSGYGGLPPQGTGYNPTTNQSTYAPTMGWGFR